MTEALILSNALDTNGQNARYVQAARKHGQDEAVIRALAIGNVDPGGVVGRLQDAASRHPEVGLSIRSAHKQDQYFRFAGDLTWGRHESECDCGNCPTRESNAEVRLLAQRADVLHLNNSDRGLFELGMSKDKKPCLLHHHGTSFRNNTEYMLGRAKAYKMVQAVSTVDLMRPAPDILHWLPTAYDVAELQAFGAANRRKPDGLVRIGHFPTNRDLKRTDLFVQVIKELQAEGLPIELVPAELDSKDERGHGWLPRWDWETTMRVKATCDIVFDQLMFGYGCNAVEAWGMGIPVVSGADEWTTKRMVTLWGATPYVHVTEKTLKAKLRRLVEDADLRAEYAADGLAHVRRYHDELPALERLAELYGEAIGARIRPRIQGKGVTFRSDRARRLLIDGETVDFSTREAVITDEAVVRKLRHTVRTRRNYGITEVDTEDVA